MSGLVISPELQCMATSARIIRYFTKRLEYGKDNNFIKLTDKSVNPHRHFI